MLACLQTVCDLVEEKKPPGVMCLLDDVCATLHAQTDGADEKFLGKLMDAVGSHQHFARCAVIRGGFVTDVLNTCCPFFSFTGGFKIIHYAGEVCYNVSGFWYVAQASTNAPECCYHAVGFFSERNRDFILPDLLHLVQGSSE